MPKNLLKLSLPFVLCLCLFEKAELPFKALYDFNWSETGFGETKAANPRVGWGSLLFGSEGGGEPCQCLLWGIPFPPKYTQVASEHLQADQAQSK